MINNEFTPPNWSWVKLGDVYKIETGNTPPKKEPDNYGNYLPFVKPPQLINDIVSDTEEFLSEKGVTKGRVLPKDSILVSCIGNLGKVGLNKFPVAFNQQINGLICNPKFNSKFTFYFCQSKNFRNQLEEVASATTIPIVNKGKFSQLKIPLPPLPEQKKIVEKIEELFSGLDSGVVSLIKAKEQIKLYRQSVLAFAFNGKLIGNGNIDEKTGLPKGWKWVKVSEICDVVRGGSPRPAGDPKYYGGNIPFLKVRDLTKDTNVYLTTFEYTIKEAGLHKTRKINPNTLLISNSGATLGIPKICLIEATMNDGIAAFLKLDERSNLYLYYFWLSKTEELRNINMGAAQPNLNTNILKNYSIPYCSFEEQTQIVEEIEKRFSEADNLEKAIDDSLKKSDALRQSILKQAFEGRLI